MKGIREKLAEVTAEASLAYRAEAMLMQKLSSKKAGLSQG